MTPAAPLTAPAARAVAAATVTVLPVFLVSALVVQIGADLNFTAAALGTAPAAFFGAAALCGATGGLSGRLDSELDRRRFPGA